MLCSLVFVWHMMLDMQYFSNNLISQKMNERPYYVMEIKTWSPGCQKTFIYYSKIQWT